MNEVTSFQDLLTSNRHIAAGIVFVAVIVGLAAFTDAIERLHGFAVKIIAGRTREARTPQPDDRRTHEFESLIRRILNVGIINNLPVELHKLRSFFIEAGLVTKPPFSGFYAQWLDHPFVEQGTPVLVPGFFSNERIERMNAELGDLRLQ